MIIYSVCINTIHTKKEMKYGIYKIKHSRYIHLMSKFSSIRLDTKRLYVHYVIVHTGITSGIFRDKRKSFASDLKVQILHFNIVGQNRQFFVVNNTNIVNTKAARLQVFCQSISRHQIVATSRLFTTIKGQNLFEVQAYFFVLKHCHDRTGKNEEYLFLHKLTKVFSSTKMMRIMPVICSQLPLENTSYIIFNAFSSLTFFHIESRQVTGKSRSCDYWQQS